MKLFSSKKSKTTITPHFSWNPIHPRKDWRALLMTFIVLSLLVVGWSTYLFLTSQNTIEIQAGVPVPETGEVSTQIERISSFFGKREVPIPPSPSVDPSL